MGSFAYYVIKERGFQKISLDYEGVGDLADNYVIKKIPIFHKFSPNFGTILLRFSNFEFGCTN